MASSFVLDIRLRVQSRNMTIHFVHLLLMLSKAAWSLSLMLEKRSPETWWKMRYFSVHWGTFSESFSFCVELWRGQVLKLMRSWCQKAAWWMVLVGHDKFLSLKLFVFNFRKLRNLSEIYDIPFGWSRNLRQQATTTVDHPSVFRNVRFCFGSFRCHAVPLAFSKPGNCFIEGSQGI